MFFYWFFHSITGWILRKQLVMLGRLSFYTIRLFYRIIRRGGDRILTPLPKMKRSEAQERARHAGCRDVVLEFASLIGSVAREAIKGIAPNLT